MQRAARSPYQADRNSPGRRPPTRQHERVHAPAVPAEAQTSPAKNRQTAPTIERLFQTTRQPDNVQSGRVPQNRVA